MSYKFNPFTGNFDDVGSGTTSIPQYDTDPVSPNAEDAWVLRTGSVSGGGSPIGLLLALTTAGTGSGYTYELKYQTQEGTTVSVALT